MPIAPAFDPDAPDANDWTWMSDGQRAALQERCEYLARMRALQRGTPDENDSAYAAAPALRIAPDDSTSVYAAAPAPARPAAPAHSVIPAWPMPCRPVPVQPPASVTAAPLTVTHSAASSSSVSMPTSVTSSRAPRPPGTPSVSSMDTKHLTTPTVNLEHLRPQDDPVALPTRNRRRLERYIPSPEDLLECEEDTSGLADRAPPVRYFSNSSNIFMNLQGAQNPFENMRTIRRDENKKPVSFMDDQMVRATARRNICPYWASGRGGKGLCSTYRTCELLHPTMLKGLDIIAMNICSDRGGAGSHDPWKCKKLRNWNDAKECRLLTEDEINVDFRIPILPFDSLPRSNEWWRHPPWAIQHYGIVAANAGHIRYLGMNMVPWDILNLNAAWWRQAIEKAFRARRTSSGLR
jgi:hypothetical protein